jgi:hypothetical protein
MEWESVVKKTTPIPFSSLDLVKPHNYSYHLFLAGFLTDLVAISGLVKTYALCTRGSFFSGWSSWSMKLITLLHLMLRLRICGAILPLLLVFLSCGSYTIG